MAERFGTDGELRELILDGTVTDAVTIAAFELVRLRTEG